MNKWECDHAGCTTTAIGAGGAIGLLAIGWHFVPGSRSLITPMQLLCPAHRPDPITCTDDSRNDDGEYMSLGKPCSNCRAEIVADIIQHAIAEHYDQLVAWDTERRLAGKRVQELP